MMKTSACSPLIYIITNSYWEETPKIRHQLASSLYQHGYRVVFFERPTNIISFLFGCKSFIRFSSHDCDNFRVVRTFKLCHYQLAFFPWIKYLNNLIESLSFNLSVSLNAIPSPDYIVNFRPDLDFDPLCIRQVPKAFIIHDDFSAQAQWFSRSSVFHMIQRVIKLSDFVFFVSPQLAKKYSPPYSPSMLFLPWSSSYTQPSNSSSRKSILFWGSLGAKAIDYSLIAAAANDLQDFDFHLYGPTQNAIEQSYLEHFFRDISNVFVLGPSELADLDKSRYFCSIAPYIFDLATNKAVYVANKTFNIMSIGLPLIVYGCIDFLEVPGLFNVGVSYSDFIAKILYCYKNFSSLQPAIKSTIEFNTFESRLTMMCSVASFPSITHTS